MARVELPSGIAAIHGRLGNMVFRSRQQPDGTYKVFVSEYKPRVRQQDRKDQTTPLIGGGDMCLRSPHHNLPSCAGDPTDCKIISRKRQVNGR